MSDTNVPDRATEIFLDGLARILTDLKVVQKRDAEAVAMIGSLADRLIGSSGEKDWKSMKAGLTPEQRKSVIGTLTREIDDSSRRGQKKIAYAMQIAATSLIGDRFEDRRIAPGIQLLDSFIASSRDYFVRNAQPENRPH